MSTVYKLKGFGDGCFSEFPTNQSFTLDFTDKFCTNFTVGDKAFQNGGTNLKIIINEITRDKLVTDGIIKNGKIQDATVEARPQNTRRKKK